MPVKTDADLFFSECDGCGFRGNSELTEEGAREEADFCGWTAMEDGSLWCGWCQGDKVVPDVVVEWQR